MRRIVRTSLRLRWLVLFLATATLALGFVQIPETKVDVFPEFAPLQDRDPDHRPRQLLQRGRAADHGARSRISSTASRVWTDLRSKSVAQLSVDPAHVLRRGHR